MINNDIYMVSNEFNITQLLSRFDADNIYEMLEEKLESINYLSSLPEQNIIASFEMNFKLMQEQFPGDSQNIRIIREQTYRHIIDILCNKFNLRFNNVDEYIDLYTAAYYLYEFTVSNRSVNMINFITAFIINNADSLYNALDLDAYRKTKDASVTYNKHIYSNNKYNLISANIENIINYICNLDISLVDIFRSIYIDNTKVVYLDNTFADNGNFFRDYYYSLIRNRDLAPKIITDIKLQLQRTVGNIGQENINAILNTQ